MMHSTIVIVCEANQNQPAAGVNDEDVNNARKGSYQRTKCTITIHHTYQRFVTDNYKIPSNRRYLRVVRKSVGIFTYW